MSYSLWTHGLQHTRLPCPSPTPSSLLKLMSIESVMPSNHLILCGPLLLLPSVFPSIRVFSNESILGIRWPKYWHFEFQGSRKFKKGKYIFSGEWISFFTSYRYIPQWKFYRLSTCWLPYREMESEGKTDEFPRDEEGFHLELILRMESGNSEATGEAENVQQAAFHNSTWATGETPK